MKSLKFLAASVVLAAGLAFGSTASATSDPITIELGSMCDGGAAQHGVSIRSQSMVSQVVEVQVFVNGTAGATLEYNLASMEEHDFQFPPMAESNVVRFVISIDGNEYKVTDWFALDDQCEYQDAEKLLFVQQDQSCVDGHTVYTYTFINEFDSTSNFSFGWGLNGVPALHEVSVPSGGTSDPVEVVLPIDEPIELGLYLVMEGYGNTYWEATYLYNDGLPACGEGDGGSGAGLPDSGSSSTTMALLAGALVLAGFVASGVAAARRRTA